MTKLDDKNKQIGKAAEDLMLETKLKDIAESSFSRHETFHPRFGWLHKSYRALTDPALGADLFLRENATVQPRAWNNMVNAIRFWSYAFKLTIEYPKDTSSRAYVASPTWEARWLLDEDGADPYLEDTASLWLLHWWLLARPCYVPTWWVAFHAQPTSRFTLPDLCETVLRAVPRWQAGQRGGNFRREGRRLPD